MMMIDDDDDDHEDDDVGIVHMHPFGLQEA